MVELSREQFSEVLPIYGEVQVDFPLIRAVTEGVQSGRIWVDNPETISNGFVLTRFGFAMLFGNGIDEEFNREFEKLIFNDPTLECGYMLWINPPERFQNLMDSMADEVARRRMRIQYRFNRQKFLDSKLVEMPLEEGVEIKRIDEDTIPMMDVFDLDFPVRLWDSTDDFLRSGIGYVALVDREMASVCYAGCVVNGAAEIDVLTLEKFRGKQLATKVSAAFCDGCLEEGITPHWDCFDYNRSSVKLAERLGFEELQRYPFYSLNRVVNKEVVGEVA